MIYSIVYSLRCKRKPLGVSEKITLQSTMRCTSLYNTIYRYININLVHWCQAVWSVGSFDSGCIHLASKCDLGQQTTSTTASNSEKSMRPMHPTSYEQSGKPWAQKLLSRESSSSRAPLSTSQVIVTPVVGSHSFCYGMTDFGGFDIVPSHPSPVTDPPCQGPESPNPPIWKVKRIQGTLLRHAETQSKDI